MKMVKKCTVCGANNRDDASFCSSCGASFTAAPTVAAPTVKPVPSVRVVSPITQPGAPIRVPPPGMCYYHSHLPAVYICNRCGRPICRDCAKMYGDLVLCPQCYQMVAPLGFYGPVTAAPAPAYAPPPVAPPPPPPPMGYVAAPPPPVAYPPARATYGFILSLVAGILILLNAAALMSAGFYTMWVGIFPWIPYFGAFPPWILLAIAVILGVIVLLGSVLMILGYGTIGAVVVFPASVITLIFGGGFVAGFVLGVIGGIMGMLGR